MTTSGLDVDFLKYIDIFTYTHKTFTFVRDNYLNISVSLYFFGFLHI